MIYEVVIIKRETKTTIHGAETLETIIVPTMTIAAINERAAILKACRYNADVIAGFDPEECDVLIRQFMPELASGI